MNQKIRVNPINIVAAATIRSRFISPKYGKLYVIAGRKAKSEVDEKDSNIFYK